MVKSARIKDETLKSLKALRRSEYDETIDDVCQRLLKFYLEKHDKSKRETRQ